MATVDLQYVGPDRDGRPVYDGDLVVYDQRVWRVTHGDRLEDIANECVVRLAVCGTLATERL